MYFGPAKHYSRGKPGTVVHVRDLFYKWPVRRKQIDGSSSHRTSTTGHIVRAMQCLAIINPEVSFTVTDLDKSSETGSEPIWSIPRTGTLEGAFSHVIGKQNAGVSPHTLGIPRS